MFSCVRAEAVLRPEQRATCTRALSRCRDVHERGVDRRRIRHRPIAARAKLFVEEDGAAECDHGLRLRGRRRQAGRDVRRGERVAVSVADHLERIPLPRRSP
jgi:hypothetical protein